MRLSNYEPRSTGYWSWTSLLCGPYQCLPRQRSHTFNAREPRSWVLTLPKSNYRVQTMLCFERTVSNLNSWFALWTYHSLGTLEPRGPLLLRKGRTLLTVFMSIENLNNWNKPLLRENSCRFYCREPHSRTLTSPNIEKFKLGVKSYDWTPL